MCATINSVPLHPHHDIALHQFHQRQRARLRGRAGRRRLVRTRAPGAPHQAGRRAGLGRALSDAARAYAQAAEGADPITRLSCRIQVGCTLQSGYFEDGAALLFSLLREHDHAPPGSYRRVTL